MIYTCPATEQVMIIERASCDDIIFNHAMIANHGAELFADDDLHHGMEFGISTDYYQQCETMGLLVSFTVRLPSEALIGYMMFLVVPDPRFKDSHQASCDAIYLEKEHRCTTFGKQMITYAEAELKDMGVNILYHLPSTQRNYGSVLKHMGYQQTEMVYARRLQ